MRTRTSRPSSTVLIVSALLIAAAIAFAVYWFGPQRLFTDERADEALPGAARPTLEVPTADAARPSAQALVTLGTGAFRSLAHETTGRARLVEGPDGAAYLRIEDLDSLAGPDLRVYLSSAPADAEADAFGEERLVADLGELRANKGNLTYGIDADVDLDAVRSVSIWCRRFSVGFGVAGLTAA
jgi:hypothetical protein